MSIFENTDQFTVLKLYLLSATSLLRYFRYYCESKKLKRHLLSKRRKIKSLLFSKEFPSEPIMFIFGLFFIYTISPLPHVSDKTENIIKKKTPSDNTSD